jgi:hypothetical protein
MEMGFFDTFSMVALRIRQSEQALLEEITKNADQYLRVSS